MNRYFGNFQLIQYNNSLSYNITERAAILSQVFGDSYAFYPYTVKNGMRAEQVAERYYGDPDLVWLVYFSNNIIDPYYQWTMSEEEFLNYIINKYGSLSNARNKIVEYRINWYEDLTNLTRLQYDSLPWYEKKYWTPVFDINNIPMNYERKRIDFTAVAQDGNGNISLSIPAEEQKYWSSVSALDIEEEENADKAHIRLLDSRLAQTAASNLKSLLQI